MSQLCACGCGQTTKPGRKFCQGHWAKTSEGRQRRRECRQGQSLSVETRAKMSAAHKGHSVTPATRDALIRRNQTGWQKTVAHKISKALTGRTYSPERLAKQIAIVKRGPAHKWWRGGTSVYPANWNKIKRAIRKRDGGLCLDCGTGDFSRTLLRCADVHHIDANKQNCADNNLISLCRRCHGLAQNRLDESAPRLRALLAERYGYSYD